MPRFQLDITCFDCPMTFVKTKRKLETLSPGDQLAVTLKKGDPLGAGDPLDQVPRAALQHGYHVRRITQVNGNLYEVVLEKPNSAYPHFS